MKKESNMNNHEMIGKNNMSGKAGMSIMLQMILMTAALIVSLIGVCGLRIAWIAVLFQIPKYHVIQTVYVSYPVSWSLTILTLAIGYIVIMKGIKKRHAERLAAN